MFTSLANVTLLIKDYDEAIKWWTEVAGLEVRMDGAMPGDDYRFVTVGVRGQNDVSIVLHKADSFDDAKSNVHGLLFHTNDCRGDVANLKAKGAAITLEPDEQFWGVQAVFEDLYGASHVILEPSPMALGQAPS